MCITQFTKRQIQQIQQGDATILVRKLRILFRMVLNSPLYVFPLAIVLAIRLIKPWILVRVGELIGSRIGHFVANTEMYLCERDASINVPNQRHVDIFFLSKPICNQQLAVMWGRVVKVWPYWVLAPVLRVNRFLPGGKLHEIGNNTQHDRDVHNLLDRFSAHLQFTAAEIARGEAGLRAIGIPSETPFVCLNVRDSAYLNSHIALDWNYHNYRDSDIQNYVLAAEALAERGYFVIRMGAKVHALMNTAHKNVIDYATNGMRSDFMDIYLGAKCAFSISTGSGWDAVPENFRRPVVFVNLVPLEGMHTYRDKFLSITKRHVWHTSKKTLSLREIFSHGLGYCQQTSDYELKGIDLIENTPEEICDVAIEMSDRLAGNWEEYPGDEALQRQFWEIFQADSVGTYAGNQLHGEIRARFGAAFLRNNPEWLK